MILRNVLLRAHVRSRSIEYACIKHAMHRNAFEPNDLRMGQQIETKMPGQTMVLIVWRFCWRDGKNCNNLIKLSMWTNKRPNEMQSESCAVFFCSFLSTKKNVCIFDSMPVFGTFMSWQDNTQVFMFKQFRCGIFKANETMSTNFCAKQYHR